MPTPIFAAVGGLPMPLLPLDSAGNAREPNGDTILNIEQASGRFRATEDSLRVLYFAWWDQTTAPTGEPGTSADAIREAADLHWLNREKYPALKRDDFARMVAFCRLKGIDPKRCWAYPVRRFANGKMQISFGLRVDAMRSIAIRTGKLVEIHPGRITYGDDERKPFRVTVTVDRLEDGRKVTVSANADLDECYQGGVWWDEKPTLMLEKTAEKKALRKAFPEQFGDVDGGDEELSDKETPSPEPGELSYVRD